VQNRLAGVDLLTPTTFPQQPAGIPKGILVFPLTSASLGSPSNTAVPSPDWDNAPINFFNDFSGCGGKAVNDCYRSETYLSPLFATETSETRTVGFDVDKNAQTVVAYLVVAADLRDAPAAKTLTLDGDEALSFTVAGLPDGSTAVYPLPTVSAGAQPGGAIFRGLYSFTLQPNIHVTKAVLHVHQENVDGTPYAGGNFLFAEHVSYGTQADGSIFNLAPLAANIGTISTDDVLGDRELDVTSSVKDDMLNGRARAQFRLRFLREPADGIATFGYPNQAHEPKLILTYREP
jgi:hypothetical protein